MGLITGASSGFGEEFSRQYAEQGHSLVLVARRLDRLQALAEALRRQHRIDVVVEQVDLSSVEEVIQLHQRLLERGIAIDILINNAGHGLHGPFLDAQLDASLAMVQLDVACLTAIPRPLPASTPIQATLFRQNSVNCPQWPILSHEPTRRASAWMVSARTPRLAQR